ncbi:hypothetical protein [Alteraurantiacibacter aquimixticola]|uniref:DedA family protein n=1 Tax=Alteraurantiacibacter aquimixticola TaxID=2489173 RepID=A0A4T3F0T5_9SPHN|nr:hypothetical protein [Alteraurantiacibacter aquimixticola]TIX49527.1 hypothetical protein E5222_11810 [Alteraurantiacibacter aquimixticola]
MTEYLILFAVVFAINLLPAFGPPTWSVIVLFGLSTDLPATGIVLVGALAAASGRFLLAHGFRLLSHHVSQRTKDNLAAARAAFERRKGHGIAALALFALSPVPSAQLFAAVGLANIRILPFTLAFFAGRLVSYSIYAGSAELVEEYTLGDTFRETLASPWGIGLQVVMIGMLVALARIPWERIFGPAEPRDERSDS